MLYYPQLPNGSVCQFPVSRQSTTRTVSNQLTNGDTIRMSDPNAAVIRWQLQYTGLTDAEWSSIEAFFETAEGMLNTFTFLDPTDNLLTWSEDWTKPIWSVDPLLQVSKGVQDPLGGTGAMQVTNTGQAAQRVVQLVGGASWFQYCLSMYLRSDAPVTVELVMSGGTESNLSVAVGSNWTRFSNDSKVTSTQDGISFGLQLPAGVRIEAFGPQAEAQPAAGYYKKTTDRAGVYAKTRFDSDSIAQVTAALNQNSGTVKLMSSAMS